MTYDYLLHPGIPELLDHALIVFDTSALLDLYNYSDMSQRQIITKIFDALKGRLWIPAQVQYEFLKNKETVAAKPQGGRFF